MPSKLTRMAQKTRDIGFFGLLGWSWRWFYWNVLHRIELRVQAVWQELREARQDYVALSQPHEPAVRALMERHIRPGALVVDLGANIGQSSTYMARLIGRQGQVIAFEAHPDNVRRLRRNLRVRGLSRRVTVENLAITDGQTKQVTLFSGRRRHPAEWNILGHNLDGESTAADCIVPALALDDFWGQRPSPDFIKMDIEGAEGVALAGMQRIMRDHQPVILVEFHGDEGWRGRRYLFEAGYSLYDVNGPAVAPDSKPVNQCLALPPS